MAGLPTPEPRAEELVVFGAIPAQLGPDVVYLRTRKIKDARPWKASLASTLADKIAGIPFDFGAKSNESVVGIINLVNLSGDIVEDLVLEYDVHDDLGGRDAFEERADDRDAWRILRQIIDVHFPFREDLLALLREVRAVIALGAEETIAVPSVPANSPNGRSSTGPSDRTKSKSGSTSRS